jgi:glycine cleavage system H protein
VSDLYAPVSGSVEERNEQLDERPELVNDDPYGQGWMIAIRPAGEVDLGDLMVVDAYRQHIE